MVRHISVPIYTFDELSLQAKERVKSTYQSCRDYHAKTEALNSLKALAKHFGGRLVNYDIDFSSGSRSNVNFDMPELDDEDIKRCLGQLGSFNFDTLKGKGECKLTGWCYDEDAIEGFRIEWARQRKNQIRGDGATGIDLRLLMHEAFKSWLTACQADYEDFYSDESFAEHCEANEYEFYEDGRFYDKTKESVGV